MTVRLLLAALLAAALPSLAPAQPAPDGPDKTIDAAERKAVIDGVLKRITEHYVFPDTARKMEESVRARQAKGEYDAIISGREFAKTLTDHLREVCQDKHLRVRFDPEPAPKDRPGRPSAEQMTRMRKFAALRNHGFKKVERLDGAVGLLELENFMPAEIIGDTAAAAMSFLANSEAVIVDLRANGGGDPAAVILLCSYFFEDQTHLNSIYNRSEDTTRQYWSHPAVPGKKLAGKDLYVLTSSRTFSGAEEFAYNMQSQKRGTIVGETTGGGAHPTRGFRVTDHFGVGVPFARSINPVTKTNWEGTGVKPDVAVPADQALLTAHLLALKKAQEKNADDKDMTANFKRVIAEKEKELEALKEKPRKETSADR
jgi:hypothetical protein